jgi:hypothetical protein
MNKQGTNHEQSTTNPRQLHDHLKTTTKKQKPKNSAISKKIQTNKEHTSNFRTKNHTHAAIISKGDSNFRTVHKSH